jgi:phage terminase large subunit-like protein
LTVELLKGQLVQSGQAIVTRGTSFENAKNLPESYTSTILAPFQGTRLGRQEIEGELLEDVLGALWSYAMLDECRVDHVPKDLVRCVVAIDPAVSTGEESAETGLIVVAQGRDGHGYVLADNSGKYSPNQWAERAKWLKQQYHADCYVAEVNQGGDLVESTLRTVDPNGRVVKVHASHGKMTRAEPVAALYEQRKMHHVDPHAAAFRILETQMTEFVPGARSSPDRLDALVWGVHELFLREGFTDYSMFNERVNVFAGLPPSYFRKPWEW